MKPIEIYKLWVDFESMIANPTLTEENKLRIGGEWLRAMPPKQLCVSSQLSYEIVEEAMRGRLDDIKRNIDGRTATTTKEETGKKSRQSKNKS